MTNLEKLNNIFCDVFSVNASDLGPGFNNQSVDGWDSVHQLSLASGVEEIFDIMLDAEDILNFTSYDNAKVILRKYDITL